MEGEPCVLFYIPEGNKNESPTSYMSITNQKYYTTIVAEQAESKAKVKDSKDSNKENKNTTATSQVASNDLYEKVRAQAELVRKIKAEKAPKVIKKKTLINLKFIKNK